MYWVRGIEELQGCCASISALECKRVDGDKRRPKRFYLIAIGV